MPVTSFIMRITNSQQTEFSIFLISPFHLVLPVADTYEKLNHLLSSSPQNENKRNWLDARSIPLS